MRFIVAIAAWLVLSVSAWAGDYTVTLTAEQEVSLAWRLKAINAERAAQDPPLASLTGLELMQTISDEIFSGIQKNLEAEAAKVGQEGWAILDPADQAAICDAYTKAGKPLPVCP